MKIADILSNHIAPFETEDMKLKSLFSFFLHLAPTISSSSAGDIPEAGLARAWASFLRETRIKNESFRFYTSGSINEKQLERYSPIQLFNGVTEKQVFHLQQKIC